MWNHSSTVKHSITTLRNPAPDKYKCRTKKDVYKGVLSSCTPVLALAMLVYQVYNFKLYTFLSPTRKRKPKKHLIGDDEQKWHQKKKKSRKERKKRRRKIMNHEYLVEIFLQYTRYLEIKRKKTYAVAVAVECSLIASGGKRVGGWEWWFTPAQSIRADTGCIARPQRAMH